MDDDFIRLWFSGFIDGYKQLDQNSRQTLMKSCAMQCANSAPIRLYQRAIAQYDGTLQSFFQALRSGDVIQTKEIVAGRVYQIMYPKCYCDLYTNNLVRDRNLCDCSRQCIIYCLTSVMPSRDFSVKTMHTILSGEENCCFEVSFSSDD